VTGSDGDCRQVLSTRNTR